MREEDPLIRRLERNALAFCLVSVGVAFVASGGSLDSAISVLAGGLLTAVSYGALKSGLDGFMQALGGVPAARQPVSNQEAATALPEARVHKGKVAFAIAKLVGRYALLALMAYVMIARLRLHAFSLIVGASSIVAAAGIEAVRTLTSRAGSRSPGGS